jgi:hypothetical protein
MPDENEVGAFRLADLPERIAAKIAVDPVTGCWLWQAKKIGKGPPAVAAGVIADERVRREARQDEAPRAESTPWEALEATEGYMP